MSLGFSQNVAVFLSTAGGVGGFVGKTLVVVVFHLDKMNIISAGLIPSVICCIGLTGYILTRDYFLLLICSSFCGFSLAFGDSALSAMLPGYLCKEHLKQGTSLSFLFGGICMQLGGILSGKRWSISDTIGVPSNLKDNEKSPQIYFKISPTFYIFHLISLKNIFYDVSKQTFVITCKKVVILHKLNISVCKLYQFVCYLNPYSLC
ncbi:hypothetical protein HOLleu_35989 [Holothuria leucospilota]|uniref:Uncharacterized protein n=1 Tax=Holothuria leucospilota TaxID=206669 RepID=A0A9Q1BDB8_HOLLE|nr:hypothetical protein HOLleu_35989 [Holothuria leucospilota]